MALLSLVIAVATPWRAVRRGGRRSERMAVAYLAARIDDALLIAVMTLLIVVQIPIGVDYLKAGTSDTSYLQALSAVLTEANLCAYEFGMTAVGVAGLILCSVFLRTNLVLRLLAGWGLAGYAILLCGSVLEILGFQLSSMHAIPGALEAPVMPSSLVG